MAPLFTRIVSSPDLKFFRRNAFTLIELLAAMALTCVMVGLLVPAISSLGHSSALSAEGIRLTDLLNRARQNSMSRNVMTAVVINCDPSSDKNGRSMALYELAPPRDGSPALSSHWKGIARWETLHTGVIVDAASDASRTPAYAFSFNSSSDVAGTPGVPVPAFPQISDSGKTISAYRYAIFLPNGSLLSDVPAQIRLAEGFYAANDSTAKYVRPNDGGKPANYYDVVILSATGRIKTYRP